MAALTGAAVGAGLASGSTAGEILWRQLSKESNRILGFDEN
jgi:hypothetical protein